MIDTANYNDFVILNGGIRYDDYNIKASGFGTQNNVPNVWNTQEQQYGMPNFNLGIDLKPMPIGSVYAAYATSSNPVGSEFDGTSAQYGGLAPALNGNPNQIFGPEKNKAIEIGTKWELFDRRLLVTAALFQTEKENARESQNVANAAAATAPGALYLPTATGNVSCITAGAAYRIRGIDLGVGGKITDKWSVFGGLVLMQSEVTKSLVPSPQPLLFPTNVGLQAGQRRASIVQHAEQVSARRTSGRSAGRRCTARRCIGGTFLAANQGTSIPSYWRFDTFVGSQDRQELDGETVRRQHHQQALLRCALSERDAVRVRRAGPQREHGDLGTVLDEIPGMQVAC